jgi:protein CpxP
MKPSRDQFTHAAARAVAAAALAATIAFAPSVVLAAKHSAGDRVEMRIKDMHTKLNITQAQEEQWGKVAEVMRENAKSMDALTKARHEHARTMTAVDDLTSYGEITEAHAEGIKKLTPVFATLYADMTDTQKTEADLLFRHGDHKKSKHN